MGYLISRLFQPPPLPKIELPFVPPRMKAGILEAVAGAVRLAYERGFLDGLIVGVLLTLLFVPSLRGRAVKGVSSVFEHF